MEGHCYDSSSARVVCRNNVVCCRGANQGIRLSRTSLTDHYKFTGKERDAETGLDYFGARYYGSNMGRFMTPDPLLNSGHPADPQSWNRYSYTINNPLTFTDPTGMYVFKDACKEGDAACKKDHDDFDQSYKDIEGAQIMLKLMGEDYAAAQLGDVLNAYGKPGDDRATIEFTNKVEAGRDAGVTPLKESGGKASKLLVRFRPGTAADGGLVAHEGTHGADMRDGSYRNMTLFQREYRAYQSQAFFAQGHYGSGYGYGKFFGIGPNGAVRQAVLWNPSWSKTDIISAPLQRDIGIRTWITNAYPKAVPIEPADPKR